MKKSKNIGRIAAGLIRMIWGAELLGAVIVLIVKACNPAAVALDWFWCWGLVWIPFAAWFTILLAGVIYIIVSRQDYGVPRRFGKVLFTEVLPDCAIYHCERGTVYRRTNHGEKQ